MAVSRWCAGACPLTSVEEAFTAVTSVDEWTEAYSAFLAGEPPFQMCPAPRGQPVLEQMVLSRNQQSHEGLLRAWTAIDGTLAGPPCTPTDFLAAPAATWSSWLVQGESRVQWPGLRDFLVTLEECPGSVNALASTAAQELLTSTSEGSCLQRLHISRVGALRRLCVIKDELAEFEGIPRWENRLRARGRDILEKACWEAASAPGEDPLALYPSLIDDCLSLPIEEVWGRLSEHLHELAPGADGFESVKELHRLTGLLFSRGGVRAIQQGYADYDPAWHWYVKIMLIEAVLAPQYMDDYSHVMLDLLPAVQARLTATGEDEDASGEKLLRRAIGGVCSVAPSFEEIWDSFSWCLDTSRPRSAAYTVNGLGTYLGWVALGQRPFPSEIEASRMKSMFDHAYFAERDEADDRDQIAARTIWAAAAADNGELLQIFDYCLWLEDLGAALANEGGSAWRESTLGRRILSRCGRDR